MRTNGHLDRTVQTNVSLPLPSLATLWLPFPIQPAELSSDPDARMNGNVQFAWCPLGDAKVSCRKSGVVRAMSGPTTPPQHPHFFVERLQGKEVSLCLSQHLGVPGLRLQCSWMGLLHLPTTAGGTHDGGTPGAGCAWRANWTHCIRIGGGHHGPTCAWTLSECSISSFPLAVVSVLPSTPVWSSPPTTKAEEKLQCEGTC